MATNKPKWFSKNNPEVWGLFTVILAFASVISFFQINSYQADKHDLNGFWTGAGIVIGLGAVFTFIKTISNSGGGRTEN